LLVYLANRAKVLAALAGPNLMDAVEASVQFEALRRPHRGDRRLDLPT
jgi:hypothetical protein